MNEPPAVPLEQMAPENRLDSWKEIAAHLKRDVTTVQRWEKREGMPVHRHVHDKLGSVYAYRSELESWMARRNPRVDEPTTVLEDPTRGPGELPGPAATPRARRLLPLAWFLAGVLVLVSLGAWWFIPGPVGRLANPLEDARFQVVTDFGGTEQAAAISRDGRFVAFLSDREGQTDVWVTQVGTAQFYNLTRGRVRELANPSVRTLGFSPDGTLVTFWARGVEGSNVADISIWAVPTLGGQPRPYLEGVAEFAWSPDGTRLAYHTPGPGDPMFVRESGTPAPGAPIFTAAPGRHAHFPTWSPSGAFLYFVEGLVPDSMDIWRIRPGGGAPERVTHHRAEVSHPVLLNERTLVYLASERDNSGPWLYSVDVERRVPLRLPTGLDGYTSLAATADGRRLVATLANPKGTLWRLTMADRPLEPSTATAISLPTARGFSPRLGPGYLLYVTSKGTGDALWKLADEEATELWSASDARIVGTPDVAPGGDRIAFSVERVSGTALYVMNADGTGARVVTASLDLRGTPSWTPDGRSITSGVVVNGTPHLFRIDLDGTAVALVRDHAVDPVWSPDGSFVVHSGADVGTTFPVKAATPTGDVHPFPALSLTRGARRLRFLPGRRALVAMRGALRHKELWLIDLDTGSERQLTNLAPDFQIRDFDVSPDGRHFVVERVHEHADIVLINLPRRP